LGNQLFQYAAGYALSQKTNSTLFLDTGLLPISTVKRGGVSLWPEQISTFAHQGVIQTPKVHSPGSTRIRQSLAGLERQLGDRNLYGFRGASVFAYEQGESLERFNRLTSKARINAYCNSPRFFAGFEQSLVTQIRTLVSPTDWYSKNLAQISDEKPLFLHVRWGDYLNLKHVYGEIRPEYYSRSVALLRELSHQGRPVWLSSDDPVGASDFLKSHLSIERVLASPPSSPPLETLLLMGAGSGLVAANSSFSWWAAFVGGQNKDFEVIFPRPLFGDAGPAEPKDWLLDSWLQRGRS
jgi:hypothetical protein